LTEFSEEEIKFLINMEEARLATSHDDVPHVKPVSFVFLNGLIVVATDYETRAYGNIKSNSNVGIVIDIYKSGEHKAVCVQGTTKIIENGPEFKKLYDIFYEKFGWVRREPWNENEAPFLKIVPHNKISWGLNSS
jgi:nitroimidazol reductase NimA-like FMN-containing flavoprotein (pyridoxamine 5'-phosphate oxidase superfamily)